MKNKFFQYTIRKTLSVILTLLYIMNATAATDTTMINVLNKSLMMIEDSSNVAQEMRESIEMMKQQEHLSDSLLVHFLVRDVAYYFRTMGKQSSAVEILLATANYMEAKQCDPSLLLKLYVPLGAAYEEAGLWSIAMECYHKALNIALEKGLKDDIARIYNNIGVAYYQIDTDESIKYFNKSLEINKLINDKKELYLNYNNLAAVNVKLNKYDDALDYALMALHMIDKEANADMYYAMQRNIGSLYAQAGDYNLSISYLRNAQKFYERNGNMQDLITTYVLLAEVYNKIGDESQTLELIKIIDTKQIENLDNAELKSKIYITLSELYENNKDYKKAYQKLQKATILKDSLMHANDERKINNFEKIFENEQLLKDNALVIGELQLKKMRSDRQFIIIAIVLLILLIVVVFLVIRGRMKDKLLKTNVMLAEQEKILQEKEKELQQIKEAELNKTIDKKNRELSSYALSYTRDNEFILNLSEELKELLLEINPRETEHKERIRNIQTQLKQHYSTDNWQEFRYYFEKVHPSFYDLLDEISPGITQRQKRLCAMLYIGLSTKEISSITFREVRSIESARNRLRKKLDIPADESIQEFLSRKMGQ